jgi:hypothetical protein
MTKPVQLFCFHSFSPRIVYYFFLISDLIFWFAVNVKPIRAIDRRLR